MVVRIAAAELWMPLTSSGCSGTGRTRSTPRRPTTAGRLRHTWSIPYSPVSRVETVRTEASSRTMASTMRVRAAAIAKLVAPLRRMISYAAFRTRSSIARISWGPHAMPVIAQ